MVLQSMCVYGTEHNIICMAGALCYVQVLYTHGFEVRHAEVPKVVEAVVRNIILLQEPAEFIIDLFRRPICYISLLLDRGDDFLGHYDITV